MRAPMPGFYVLRIQTQILILAEESPPTSLQSLLGQCPHCQLRIEEFTRLTPQKSKEILKSVNQKGINKITDFFLDSSQLETSIMLITPKIL